MKGNNNKRNYVSKYGIPMQKPSGTNYFLEAKNLIKISFVIVLKPEEFLPCLLKSINSSTAA